MSLIARVLPMNKRTMWVPMHSLGNNEILYLRTDIGDFKKIFMRFLAIRILAHIELQ